MRESRTYGSVRGARDEIRVPTATASRLACCDCSQPVMAQSGLSVMSGCLSAFGVKRTLWVALTYRDFMSTRRSLPPAEILIFRPEPFVDRGCTPQGHFPRSVYGAAFRES